MVLAGFRETTPNQVSRNTKVDGEPLTLQVNAEDILWLPFDWLQLERPELGRKKPLTLNTPSIAEDHREERGHRWVRAKRVSIWSALPPFPTF